MKLLTKEKFLPIFLWLIAIHSFFVGLGLILSPAEFFEFLGYNNLTERFFPTQGGVFHILMSVGYLLAVLKIKESYDLVIFSIIVKSTASLFLIIYFLAALPKMIILLSGVGDGVMAIILWWSFSKYKLETNL
jgi:hypothetical protein